MAFKLANRAFVLTATTGTGSISLGSVVAGYQSFSAAGITDGDTVRYTIEDGTNWEIGTGTLSNSVGTMARNVIDSSGGGSALTLSGSAKVFLTSTSVDMQTGVNITGGSITGMSSPTANSDVTTKLYVDSIAAAGIAYHTPVRLCTTGALSAAYSNGTSGVGATLTNNSTQAALTIDGVLTQTNDRILVDQQSNSAHNGIYTVTTVGSGAANWVLTRATDADSYENTGSTGLGQGSAVFVSAGSANAGELHVCNVVGVITFGTTNITFVLVADNSFYTAGAGITLTGNQFSIDTATSNAITANTAKVTNATHTGEVTGSGALTIADNIVDEANLKVSNSPTNGYFLSAQSGNTGGLTWAAAGASLYNANESSPAGQPNATGANAVAIGDSAAASGYDSIAIGETSVASGHRSIALGYNAKSSYQSIAGPNSNATGGSAVALGIANNSSLYGAKGDWSFATGLTAIARGDGSKAMGNEAHAYADHSLALGQEAYTEGTGAVALGKSRADGDVSLAAAINNASSSYGTTGAGNYGIALGSLARVSATYSVSIGYGSVVQGSESLAIGRLASAGGVGSVAIGKSASASTNGAISIGDSSASSSDSFAAMIGASASATKACAIGTTAISSGMRSYAIGGTASGSGAVAIGRYGGASGTGAVTLGQECEATNTHSVALGNEARSIIKGKIAYASEKFSQRGDGQGATYILYANTTNATVTNMSTNISTADDENQIIIPSGSSCTFHGTVVAQQQSSQGTAYAGWEIKGMLSNATGSPALALGNVSDMAAVSASSWNVSLATSFYGGLEIKVTGESGHNIRWVANIRTSEVGYA